MKKYYFTILLFFIFIVLTADGDSLNLPLKLETNGNRSIAASKVFHFQNGYVTLDFPTSSGKLKLRSLNRKLYVDSNNDGKIDASDKSYGNNGIFKIPATVCGRKISYPIFIDYVTPDALSLRSLLYFQTSYKKYDIKIFDSDLDGYLTPGKGDQMKIGNAKRMPFVNSIMIDDKVFTITLLSGKDQLQLAPYTGEYAKLKLKAPPNWKVALTLIHQKTKLAVKVDTDREYSILPGEYKIKSAEATMFGKSDSDDENDDLFAAFDAEPPVLLTFKRLSQNQPFPEVKLGVNEVLCGPSFKLDVTVKQSDSRDWRKITLSKLSLSGRAGEKYKLEAGGENGKSLLASYIRSGTKEQMLSKMEYG
jgi:hypothetical protein